MPADTPSSPAEAPLPLGEFAWLKHLRDQETAFPADVEVGPGDDCAVLRFPPVDGDNDQLLITTDGLLEGTHFTLAGPHAATPEDVGHKLLGVSLSDIAAMGGLPTYAVVMIGFTEATRTNEFRRRLSHGLRQLASRFDVRIIGGDVTAWPRENAGAGLALNLTLLGRTAGVPPLLRRGAAVGDIICITGRVGGSLANGRHLRVEPRVQEGRLLAENRFATAMLDISDGLAQDLGHILEESGVGAELMAQDIPIHPDADLAAASSGRSALWHALTDGEDFELCFTVAPNNLAALQSRWPFANVPCTPIGQIVEGNSLSIVEHGERQPWQGIGGFDHLR